MLKALSVTGAVLGCLIVAVFALSENKRQEMLEMVGRLRTWEG